MRDVGSHLWLAAVWNIGHDLSAYLTQKPQESGSDANGPCVMCDAKGWQSPFESFPFTVCNYASLTLGFEVLVTSQTPFAPVIQFGPSRRC